MMTREEFLKRLNYVDDTLTHNQFSSGAQILAAHEAEQRQVIEQQANEIALWRDCYKEAVREFIFQHRPQLERNHELIQQQAATINALREALEAISRRAPIMGSTGDYRDGQLHALQAVREQAQRVLKEVTQ